MRATDLSAAALAELKLKKIDIEDTKASLRTLFESWVPKLSIPANGYERMFDVFLNAVTAGEGVSVEEALNRHYARHRNRHHFGHGINSLAQNEIALHPLSQIEFSRAANLWPISERRSGVVAFDLIASVAPSLNHIEFDSDDWPSELLSRETSKFGRPTPSILRTSHNEVGIRQLKEIDKLNIAARRAPKTVALAGTSRGSIRKNYDAHQTLEYRARTNLATLHALSENTGGFLDGESVGRLVAGSQGSTAALVRLVPKLESAMDVLGVISTDHAKLTIHPQNPGTRANERRFEAPLEDHIFPRALLAPFEQHPTLSLQKGEFVAEANLITAVPEDALFAFYLYRNGERISTVWYQHAAKATFQENTAGEYSARVFMRIDNNPLITMSKITKTVII